MLFMVKIETMYCMLSLFMKYKVATVLEIREKSGNLRKKKKVREIDRLSEPKSSTTP